jgi:hypothetical protein
MTADGRDPDTTVQKIPQANLALTFDDGIIARLELLSRDEQSYFMCIDGVITPYYIHAKRLLDLLDRVSELSVKKPNKSSQI